ncbi:MAG: uracil-DNA glycosylase [Nocardioidaceae bacterium]
MSDALPHPITGQLFSSPVPPGTGWPDDPATSSTTTALDAEAVVTLAASREGLPGLDAAVSVCRACPRLVAWREQVAVDKRASFATEPYWGRPIPGWGSDRPSVLIVGLAPAANGGNRTGRIFTGDRSGDWLFGSLNRVGLATRPTSVHAGDGQALIATRLVAAVRCVPPANKPTTVERDTCAPWFDAELTLVMPTVRAVVCLGSFGWLVTWSALTRLGYAVPKPRPKFGHGVRVDLPGRGSARVDGAVRVLGCFHPSQQNTFTGKLTEPMLDEVLAQAAAVADLATG